jgi:hypothetical protein
MFGSSRRPLKRGMAEYFWPLGATPEKMQSVDGKGVDSQREMQHR